MSEKLSYNQISNQQAQHNERATVLTRRSNGEIQTAKYVGQREDGKYYVELNDTDENGVHYERPISPNTLSDAGQAQLAEELGASRVVDNDVADETMPREQLHAMINEQERVASEEVREELGETAMDAIGIQEPTTQLDTPAALTDRQDDGERAAAARRHLEQLREARLEAPQPAVAEPMPEEEPTPDTETQTLEEHIDEPASEEIADEHDTESAYNEALDKLKTDMEQQLKEAQQVVDMIENSATAIRDTLVSRFHYVQNVEEAVYLVSQAKQTADMTVEDRMGLPRLAELTEDLEHTLRRFTAEQAEALADDRQAADKHEAFVSRVRRELAFLTDTREDIEMLFKGMDKINDMIQALGDWIRRGGVLDTRNVEHETIQLGARTNDVMETTHEQTRALLRIQSAFDEARQ